MDAVAVRASSWPELFDCALRWYYKHIEGITGPSAGRAWLGTSIHRATAEFDAARLLGEKFTAHDAALVLVDSLTRPDEDVAWGDITKREAEQLGLQLLARYCHEIAPYRTYSEVEIECDPLEISVGETTIRLTGTADRVRVYDDGSEGISDIKSGVRAVNTDGTAKTKGHGLQMGVYTLLAERKLQRPLRGDAEIIGLQTNSKGRVGTAIIPNVRDRMLGTEKQAGSLEHAAMYFSHEIFPANPTSMLCTERYCPAWSICQHKDS